MELQKTFIYSLLAHVTFSVALFLSAGFLGGSGSMLNEQVFYVNITKEIVSAYEDASAKIESVVPKTSEKVIEEAMSVKVEAVEEEFLTVKATEPVVASKRSGPKEAVQTDTSLERLEAVQSFYVPPASGGSGIVKGKAGGILPSGIITLIGSAIEKAKTYPALARKRGMEGTVYVGFHISAEGEPQDIVVIKSSGYKILDKATLKVVRKAGPYPHIEDRIEVPITYRLKEL